MIVIDERQIYFQLEVTSLYDYCVGYLELPTHTAYDFLDVIRKSKLVPALAEAVIEERTTMSKARRVCSVINPENQTAWIELACECSQKIIRKAVATANPRSIVSETLNYVSSDVLELRLAVSEEWAELLANTKDVMSQQEQRAVSTEEALFSLMARFRQKNDPVKKAERANARTADMASKNSEIESARPKNTSPRTRYRPRLVEHEVDLRDKNQCIHVDRRGRRCSSKRWLHKHHVTELARGGRHSADNIETLCSAHHRMKHRVMAE